MALSPELVGFVREGLDRGLPREQTGTGRICRYRVPDPGPAAGRLDPAARGVPVCRDVHGAVRQRHHHGGGAVWADPRRPKRVAAGRGRQIRGQGPPLDHRQDETPRQRPARQPPPRRVDALEERRLRLVELGRREVVVERRGRPMVGRDIVPLAALLVQPEPPPALLPEVVLPPHRDDRAHPREAVEHHRDERPVAQARERTGIDHVEEPTGLGRREHRRRALGDHVLGPPHDRRRVHREDLADDEPVAEHADGGRCCLTVGADPGCVRM